MRTLIIVAENMVTSSVQQFRRLQNGVANDLLAHQQRIGLGCNQCISAPICTAVARWVWLDDKL